MESIRISKISTVIPLIRTIVMCGGRIKKNKLMLKKWSLGTSLSSESGQSFQLMAGSSRENLRSKKSTVMAQPKPRKPQ
jgi:hypothetical protein